MIPNMPPVSPSSIKTFKSCNRKWWWNKIMQVPDRDSPAAMLGTKLHQQLEDWLLLEKLPESERIREVLSYFPSPADVKQGGVLVEEWLRTDLKHTKFRGRADVIDVRDKKNPIIYDLKTTGNIVRALSAKRLKEDLQMLCYGYNTLQQIAKDAEQVTFKHVYVQTKKEHKHRIVTAVATYGETQQFWKSLEPTIDDMVITSAEEWSDAVPMSKDFCFAYGGCAYQTLCDVRRKR